ISLVVDGQSVSTAEDQLTTAGQATLTLSTPVELALAPGPHTIQLLGQPTGVTASNISLQATEFENAPARLVVNYGTSDGHATVADGDSQAASGTLTFLPGDTSKLITVQVNGDTRTESDESFGLQLTNATNMTLASATGTIQNDDPPAIFATPQF